jgi:Domain of unknown function (DUF4372)
MNEGHIVLAQLLDFLPKYEFDKCVARYHGNFRVRKLPTYEQFLVLAFAQDPPASGTKSFDAALLLKLGDDVNGLTRASDMIVRHWQSHPYSHF